LGWIKKIRKSNNIFYVAVATESALDYQVKTDSAVRDKLRWRTDIGNYWKKKDAARLRAIAEVVSPTGGGL
jgi:hypothetical protein